ncbi:ATP-binding protein [Actinosynnema sp. NPDC059335]|uniref:ATP-binding protein n=1 Tax=Actinosynnema sp. NPDC059335 TaxID=3346804 RepID=UPI003671DC0B
MTALALHRTDVAGVAVLRPAGTLDLTTYRDLRDGLLECAADEPTALVVRLDDGFECATPAFMSVFTTVCQRVAEWPGVPVLLVAETPGHRRSRAAAAVPRFTTLTAALAAAERPPDHAPDHRAEIRLPASLAGGRLARCFVRDACERWVVAHLVPSAATVATELVENAVRHARSAPVLRLRLNGRALTIAVCDDDPDPPATPAVEPLRPGGRGIMIVSSLSRTWGCYRRPRGGKIVWAVLDG